MQQRRQVLQVRALVQDIFAHRYTDCLMGESPAIAFSPVALDRPEVRALRDSACMGALPRRDRLCAVWYRDQRWFLLLQALLRNSAWVNGTALPLSVAELATLSGMSGQAVLLALRQARDGGDFTSDRAMSDRRRLLMEPSAAVRDLAEWRRYEFTRAAATYAGREDPSPRLTPDAAVAWRRLFIESTFTLASMGPNRAAQFGVSMRAFLLWDMLLDGPQRTVDFVPRHAARLRTSNQTIRNRLAWLRQHGWLEQQELLVATPMAAERFSAMVGVFDGRVRRVLDLLEMLAEHPWLAECLKPGPHDARGAQWEMCRYQVEAQEGTATPAAPDRSGAWCRQACALLPPR